jgi:hypothetical protein
MIVAAHLLVTALYSHWTNVLLLLPAVATAIALAARLSLRGRVIALVKYGVFVAVTLAPLVILILLMRSALSPTEYLEMHEYGGQPVIGPLVARSRFWFAEGIELFSIPGMAAGIAGVLLLAIKSQWRLPALLVVIHFICTALIPGFTWNGSNTYLRTYIYLVPLMSLGMGALCAWAIDEVLRWFARPRPAESGTFARPLVAIIALVVAAAHFLPGRMGQAATVDALATRSPNYYADYIAGQSRLRPAVAELMRLLPEQATIIPSGWGPRDIIFSVAAAPTSHYRFPFTLENALTRVDDGSIGIFFKRRGITADAVAGQVFVVSDEPMQSSDIAEKLRKICGPMEGMPPDSSFVVEPIENWRVGAWALDSIYLYSVTRQG